MNRLVVDASAFIEYLLGLPHRDTVRRLLEAADAELHTTALCDVEVVAGLRRALMRRPRRLDERRAYQALDDYSSLPLGRHAHEPLLERVLELRENFGAYDATYVALTELVGAELLTADRKLARAVRAHLPLVVHSP